MSDRYARPSLKKYWRVYEDAPGDADNLGIAEGLNVISEELIEEAHSMTEDAMPPDLVDNEGRVVIDIQSGVLYEETSYSTSEEQRAYGEDASGVLGTYPDETDKEARTSVGAEAGNETMPLPTDSLKAYWRVYEDEPGDADNLGFSSRASDRIQLELADEQTGGAAIVHQQIVDAVVPGVLSARPEDISEEIVGATRYSGEGIDDQSLVAVSVNAETYIGRVRSSGTATSAEGVAHAGNKRSTEADVTSSDKTTTRSSQDENTEENINPSDQNTVDSSADGKTKDITAGNRSGEDINATRSLEDENAEENINTNVSDGDASGVLGIYPDETDKEARISVGAEAGQETIPRPRDSLKAYWRVYEDEPGDADNHTTDENINPSDQTTVDSSADGKTEDIAAVTRSGEDIKATRSSEDENTKENINPSEENAIDSSADGKTENIAAVTRSSDDIKATRSSEDENTEENINPSDNTTIDLSADGKTENIAAVTRSGDDIKATRSSEDENTEENINPSDQTTIDSSADGKTQDIAAGNRSGDDIKATRSPEDENTEENINPSDHTTNDSSADGKTEDITTNRSTEDIKTTRSSEDENDTEAGAKLVIGAEAGYTQDGGIERVEDETLETNTNLHVSNVEDKNAQQQQLSTSGDGNATVVEAGLNSENETTDDPRRMSLALDEHTEESSEELPRINHVNTHYGNDVFTRVV